MSTSDNCHTPPMNFGPVSFERGEQGRSQDPRSVLGALAGERDRGRRHNVGSLQTTPVPSVQSRSSRPSPELWLCCSGSAALTRPRYLPIYLIIALIIVLAVGIYPTLPWQEKRHQQPARETATSRSPGLGQSHSCEPVRLVRTGYEQPPRSGAGGPSPAGGAGRCGVCRCAVAA